VNGRDIEILVLDDEEAAAEATADRLAEAARAGLEIALTGGSTPRRAYELAALREPDWSRAGAWWGDERCVPPEDERSNYRLARKSLIDRLSSPPRVHRIRGELEPADAAAAEYERELGETRLDLVLLGLGPDGHVASLFPGAPTLEERERRVVAAEAGLEPFVPRVTLTLPVLCSGRSVLFLVTGEEKVGSQAACWTFCRQSYI
jgi:6-phosphogluconolactonase